MNLTDENILGSDGEVMGLTTTGMPCFNVEPKEVIAFARALLKEAGVEEPEGWQLVPVRPTDNMNSAYIDEVFEATLEAHKRSYQVMLAAVPKYEQK